MLTIIGAVTGAIVAYGTYYTTRVAGLVIADYATCGGYMPLGCFTFNPFVPLWFIFTGSVSGFEALLIFAVKRGVIKPPAIPQPSIALLSAQGDRTNFLPKSVMARVM